MRMPIKPEPQRFYDATKGSGNKMTVALERVPVSAADATEEWYVTRKIGYCDREFEKAGEPDIVIPREMLDFRTDLTSVPQLMTWLVGRTGTHLPAALVHDALTKPFLGRDGEGNVLKDWIGPAAITQLQADRVFRDAMADLGTPVIRRWLVWSAVSLPTAWTVSKLRASLGYLGLAAIIVLGWFATLDLFDRGAWLPWMGNDKAWGLELVYGGAMAIAVPVALSTVWPKGTRQAGMITGIALAALIHVTAAVGAVTFAYQFAEYRFRVWAPPKRWLKVSFTALGICLVLLTYWMVRRYDPTPAD
ncbi:MAG: DUF1353 domain-containing protein [Actinobacteria bacterium]|nr:DUF1353 domain-containing protein [Actinomycetota bacterium]